MTLCVDACAVRALWSPLMLLSVVATTPVVMADSRLDMQGTQVIGNRELPNMLYIIPWKSIKPVELTPPPTESVMNQPIRPLDRGLFRRQLMFYDRLHPGNP